MLYEFIQIHREEIIKRCRAKVATRSVPAPTAAEIDHGVPLFLDQLVATLRGGGAKRNTEITKSAVLHGRELLLQGFTVSQVVHDYGDVCQSVTDLAVELNAPISTDDFRTLNRCLDDAIAGAVTEFGRGRSQSGIEGEAARGSERLGFLAHELRNLTNTALLAFEALKTGSVGIAGNTGAVLQRSLLATRGLIERSLGEVRLTQSVQHRERIEMAEFIAELTHAAALEASARGVTLTVMSVADGVTVEADRQVLAAVVGNLLQNALKFTRPGTTVMLRVGVSTERVFVDVEDECGGLPDGKVEELFSPFQQRSTDRTGLGLGLAFSRWGAHANNGQLHARNLPGKGCVFTLDLPRVSAPTVVTVQ